MSWMPAQEPILGDKRTCDALELIIVPRVRELGGFSVHRALPHAKRQVVGPLRPSPIFLTAASCTATARAMRSRLLRAR